MEYWISFIYNWKFRFSFSKDRWARTTLIKIFYNFWDSKVYHESVSLSLLHERISLGNPQSLCLDFWVIFFWFKFKIRIFTWTKFFLALWLVKTLILKILLGGKVIFSFARSLDFFICPFTFLNAWLFLNN